MNTNALFGFIGSLLVLALVAAGAWMYFSGNVPALVANNAEQNAAAPEGEEDAGENGENEGPAVDPEFHALISYTDEGFSPASVNIERGQTVRFVNNSSGAGTWPASAVHPTHTIYPGSSISKCDTEEQAGIFDACRELQPGEFWEFTFNEAGEWRYHDHVHAYHTGAIIVAE